MSDTERLILAWQDMDTGRAVRILAVDEVWSWEWRTPARYDTGDAGTVSNAIAALYRSLVAAGEINQ